MWWYWHIWSFHLGYSSHSLTGLVQCNHCLVLLSYLKFSFELHMLFTTELVLPSTVCFIKASLEDGSSTLNFAGPPTEIRNTGPVHLFVWISLDRFNLCIKALQVSTFFKLMNRLFNSYMYCTVHAISTRPQKLLIYKGLSAYLTTVKLLDVLYSACHFNWTTEALNV